MNPEPEFHGVRGETVRHEPPALPLTMEGPREEVSEEIAQVSPEGKPADPKAGPGLLAIEIAIAVVIFAAFAIGIGLWLGWAAGIALFAIAMMGLAFNPAAIAALLRIRERRDIAARRRAEQSVRVVRSRDIERPATGP